MKKYFNHTPGHLPVPFLLRQHALLTTGIIFLLMLVVNTTLMAQPNITRVEYYIDADPGYNKAIPLNIVAGKDIDGLTFNVSLAPLSQGVHMVGIRSKDANGAWSIDNKWLFLKPYPAVAVPAQPNITRVEYYIDVDPGYGSATPLNITPAKSVNGVTLHIDLNSVSTGVHIVGVRSQDKNGAWSLDNKWLFIKPYANTGAVAAPKINRVEYFIDDDPGYGNGTALNITPGANIDDLTFNVNLVPLSAGVHVVGVRSLDANGAWSLDNHWVFLKPYPAGDVSTGPKINRIEYFIDNDPGYGNATALNFNSAITVSDLTFNINMAALSQGVHMVGVRSRDVKGAWSLDNHWIFLKPYTITATAAQPNIVKAEFYVDYDPGYGKGGTIPIVAGKDIANINFNADLTGLANGPHFIGVRTQDANGAWSLDNQFSFTYTKPLGLLSGMSDVSQLKQQVLTNGLKLQYNPVHQQAVVLYTSTKDDKTVIRVVDNLGKTVVTKEARLYTGVNIITLETGALAQGIYTVQAIGAKENLFVRMLKQ